MVYVIAILSFGASALVRWWMTRTYSKWGGTANAVGATGWQVARHILDSNGLHHVKLEVSQGLLSDHYIPGQKLMRLSEQINAQPSVAAIAVAAHECGHAIQDAEGYSMLRLKAVLMPIAALGNQLGMMLALGGGMLGSPGLMNLGMVLLISGVVMPLVTLPIEFDASKRALAELTRLRLVDQQDLAGARSMLRAAALTYLAGAASSIAIAAFFLLRFLRR